MTKNHFKEIFDQNFWWWVGGEKPNESSFWLAVEEYAHKKFNECYEREEAAKKELKE